MARKQKKEKAQAAPQPSTRDKMLEAACWLHEKKAKDIEAMDVTGLCSIAEGMILATAGGIKHAQALAGYVLDRAGEQGWDYMGMEGQRSGAWVLLDLNDVVVHVFQEDSRGFYNLEGLWAEAERLELDLKMDQETGPRDGGKE